MPLLTSDPVDLYMLHYSEREVENWFWKVFGVASSFSSLGFLDMLHAQTIFVRLQGACCHQTVLSNKIAVFSQMYCYSPDFQSLELLLLLY